MKPVAVAKFCVAFLVLLVAIWFLTHRGCRTYPDCVTYEGTVFDTSDDCRAMPEIDRAFQPSFVDGHLIYSRGNELESMTPGNWQRVSRSVFNVGFQSAPPRGGRPSTVAGGVTDA